MELFPLVKKKYELAEKKQKIDHVYIPLNWWHSSNSISFNFVQKKQSQIHKISSNVLPNTPGWDVKKGDYRVSEPKVIKHDYIYYRDLKIKILKNMLYPVIFFTIIFVFGILKLLVKT